MSARMPTGWASSPIRSLFNCWGGLTPATSVDAYWGGETPWISSKDIRGWRVAVGTEFVTQKALAETRLRPCRPGSVLVVVRSGVLAHTLPVALSTVEAVVNQDIKVLDSGDDRLNEWLSLYLRANEREILSRNRKDGTTVQSVRVDELLDLDLPVPPIAEQQRISHAIETLLGRLNDARHSLLRLPVILKRFRRSVLAAACSGRLTEDWRARRVEEESPTALLQRALRTRSSPHSSETAKAAERKLDHPATWCLCSCDQISDLVTSGSRGWAKYYSTAGALFIRAQNINTDRLVLDDVAHVTPPRAAEGVRTKVRPGDLLITITGANVTKAAVVDNTIEEAYVSQHVALVRPVLPELARWLHLWTISHSHGRAQLLEAAYGAGKPGLNLDNVREMVVALPSIDEQREILQRVEGLDRIATAIEARIANASAHADSMTQVILAKAFSGELVPAEAELAAAEARDYEPATALLERVRSERSANTTRHTIPRTKRVSRRNGQRAKQTRNA